MPNLQQSGDGVTRLEKRLDLDLQRLMDSSVEESFTRATNADGESVVTIADLLGLNMPRGSLVGDAQGVGGSPAGTPPGPQYLQSSPRPFTCDDSGFSPGSPARVPGVTPLDMSTPRKSGMGLRGRLDSVGTFPPLSPSSSGSPLSQFSSSLPSSIGTARGMRSSPSFSECLESTLLRNSGSRSNSPDSDSSGVSSLDSGNLSELMSCLSMNQSFTHQLNSATGYSGLQRMCGSPEQHELTNFSNLHTLQTIPANNAALKYYQRHPELQPALLSLLQNQSPPTSPLNSPLSPPEKLWGSGSPHIFSSPLQVIPQGTPPSPGWPSPTHDLHMGTFDRPSRSSRDASPLLSGDATCSTWSGNLPAKRLENATCSVKVFLGGVPWDINEAMLINAFKQIGQIRVEWPSGKNQSAAQTKQGYAYVIFECERQVRTLLQHCTYEFTEGSHNWYFKISSKRMKGKAVQVIPWLSTDTNWVRSPSQKLDPDTTVFVGGLHGMLNAEGLAQIMGDLFGSVVYAGIDTDKFKYPIGSARVTFSNLPSYWKAIRAAFVEITTPKFEKRVQVNPYLEDSPCAICRVQQGPYFCRTLSCYRYFCRSCWFWYHSLDVALSCHFPVFRGSKSGSVSPTVGDPGSGVVGMGMSMRHRGGMQRN